MSGRRFDQIFKYFNSDKLIVLNNGTNKKSLTFYQYTLLKNFQRAYSPTEHLLIDESVLLH